MNSKKIIATSLLGASMLGTAIYSNNVIAHAEQENEELEAKIKENEQKKAEEEAKALSASGTPYFGADGLLVERHTAASQNVINLLLGIPNHSNGAYYHQATGLDSYIDQLSVEEAVNVIHRIEGAGFGQTGAGYAGFDTPESHQVFLRQQVHGRFGGDVRQLLKKWGTYSYGGY